MVVLECGSGHVYLTAHSQSAAAEITRQNKARAGSTFHAKIGFSDEQHWVSDKECKGEEESLWLTVSDVPAS